MLLITLLIVIVIGPYALLTLGGVLLWRRHRTFATLLIALGCLTTLVSEVANFIIVGPSLVGFVSAFVGDINQLCTQTPVEQLVRYLGLLMAAVGLVWHAVTIQTIEPGNVVR